MDQNINFLAIRREFQAGHSPSIIYSNLSNKKDISIEDLQRWLKKIDNIHDVSHQVQQIHTDLQTSIDQFHLIFQKSMYYSTSSFNGKAYELTHGNPRYGFKMNCNKILSFNIYDYFCGKEKTIFVADILSTENTNRWFDTMYPICLDRILCVEKSKQTIKLRLLQFDFEEQMGEVLDLAQVKTNFWSSQYPRLVFDQTDRQKFAILMEDNDMEVKFALLGFISGNKIFVEDSGSWSPVLRDIRESDTILQDGKLIYLHQIENEAEENWIEDRFGCISFPVGPRNPDQVERFKLKLFGDELKNMRFSDHNFIWWNNSFYILIKDKENQHFHIIKADLISNECKLLPIDIKNLDALSSSNIEMEIDQKYDVLTILYNESVMYRFPLRKPEPLQHLTWFAIRRHSLLIENPQFYENALKNLPQTSRVKPFYIENQFGKSEKEEKMEENEETSNFECLFGE